jgi:hypothetical protein
MIHVVAMKCLIGLPLLIHIELLWRSRSRSLKFEESEVLKIEESQSESKLLCTNSKSLPETNHVSRV